MRGHYRRKYNPRPCGRHGITVKSRAPGLSCFPPGPVTVWNRTASTSIVLGPSSSSEVEVGAEPPNATLAWTPQHICNAVTPHRIFCVQCLCKVTGSTGCGDPSGAHSGSESAATDRSPPTHSTHTHTCMALRGAQISTASGICVQRKPLQCSPRRRSLPVHSPQPPQLASRRPSWLLWRVLPPAS